MTAGKNTTTYTSTGSDTIGDVFSTLNTNLPANAQVTASINSQGRLVITSKNTTDQISISGVFASNLGYAVGNQQLQADQGQPAVPLDLVDQLVIEHEQLKQKHVDLDQERRGVRSAFSQSATQRRDPLGIVRRQRQPGQSAGLIGPRRCWIS